MSITTPNPQQGDNGDIQLLQTNLGVKLFGKVGGRWHSTSLTAPEGSPTLKFGNSLSDHLSVDTSAINVFEGSVKVASFGKYIFFGSNNKIIIGTGVTDNIVISDASHPGADKGTYNVSIGPKAGNSLTSGCAANVLIGSEAGEDLVTNAEYIYV